MKKIIALGEILIDFTPVAGCFKPTFEQNAGGAPMNVLACASKLGVPTSFIGCVGKDSFGIYLKDFLTDCHIDNTNLKISPDYHTTLAFVSLGKNGERDFSFYRNHGADKMLSPEDIQGEIFQFGDIFHFGSISMTHEPSKSATLHALSLAKKSGCLVSYDPNLRPLLWDSPEKAKETILSVLDQVNILKVSQEELVFITGEENLSMASKSLVDSYGISLIIITQGKEGSAFYYKNTLHFVEGFPVKAVDTTGAGDSHLGAFLFQLLSTEEPVEQLSSHQIENMVRFANRTAAIVTTRYGSAEIMPSHQEIISWDFSQK